MRWCREDGRVGLLEGNGISGKQIGLRAKMKSTANIFRLGPPVSLSESWQWTLAL